MSTCTNKVNAHLSGPGQTQDKAALRQSLRLFGGDWGAELQRGGPRGHLPRGQDGEDARYQRDLEEKAAQEAR